jgi:hypothetical protein
MSLLSVGTLPTIDRTHHTIRRLRKPPSTVDRPWDGARGQANTGIGRHGGRKPVEERVNITARPQRGGGDAQIPGR